MSLTEKTLQQLRTGIDSVDQRLVRSINQRAELEVERAQWMRKQLGKRVVDRSAESDAVAKVIGKNGGPIPNSALQGVYREILNGAFVLGRNTRVGYLGPQGTFSHLAASQFFGDSVDYENLRALEGVFEEVSRGHVDYGLVPIENSTGGAIIEVANTQILTVQGDHWRSTKAEALSAKNCGLDNIQTRFQATIRLQADCATQVIAAQGLLDFSQTQLKR